MVTGTMPVMLEVSCIISAAAGDWPDFFVILAMVLAAWAVGPFNGVFVCLFLCFVCLVLCLCVRGVLFFCA